MSVSLMLFFRDTGAICHSIFIFCIDLRGRGFVGNSGRAVDVFANAAWGPSQAATKEETEMISFLCREDSDEHT